MGRRSARYRQVRGLMIGRTAGNYAPIDQVQIDPSSLELGVVSGYAAPSHGPKPCLLELIAGRDILATARACGFSENALIANLRFGWCGFKLGGLDVAGALGRTVELRCAVSGLVIETWTSENLLHSLAAPRPTMRVTELREFAQGLYGCSNLAQI